MIALFYSHDRDSSFSSCPLDYRFEQEHPSSFPVAYFELAIVILVHSLDYRSSGEDYSTVKLT